MRLSWVNPARCLPACMKPPAEGLVVVDDRGALSPRGHHQVAPSAQPGLHDLITAARAAGHLVKVSSAYRSYDDQARVYRETTQIGRAARPGHSEHQLGTAIDLRLPTKLAIDWLAAHAADFGFALSYPDGKQRLTGYRPEPWHIRYVGQTLAERLRGDGQILEELFRAHPEIGESGSCEDCEATSSRAPCGTISAAGVCTGTVLGWCFDGALANVDCAVSGQMCGPSSDGTPDCLAAPTP